MPRGTSLQHDSDNTHGSAIYHTIFRNHLLGFRRDFPGLSNGRAAGLAHGSWWHTFIGNVMGVAGQMGGWQYEDPGNGRVGNAWGGGPSIWKLGYDRSGIAVDRGDDRSFARELRLRDRPLPGIARPARPVHVLKEHPLLAAACGRVHAIGATKLHCCGPHRYESLPRGPCTSSGYDPRADATGFPPRAWRADQAYARDASNGSARVISRPRDLGFSWLPRP